MLLPRFKSFPRKRNKMLTIDMLPKEYQDYIIPLQQGGKYSLCFKKVEISEPEAVLEVLMQIQILKRFYDYRASAMAASDSNGSVLLVPDLSNFYVTRASWDSSLTDSFLLLPRGVYRNGFWFLYPFTTENLAVCLGAEGSIVPVLNVVTFKVLPNMDAVILYNGVEIRSTHLNFQ